MAFNLDLRELLAMRAPSILESMAAQKNTALNQDKLRADILNQQLANQKSQALLPYAVPKEKAGISEQLAKALYERTSAQYIPEKTRIAALANQVALQNMLINQRRYSDPRLQLADQLTQAKISESLARAKDLGGGTVLDANGQPLSNGNSQGIGAAAQNSGMAQIPLRTPSAATPPTADPETGESYNWRRSEIGKGKYTPPKYYVDDKTGARLYPFTQSERDNIGKERDAFDRLKILLPEFVNIATKSWAGGPDFLANKLNANLNSRYQALMTEIQEDIIPTFKNSPKVKNLLNKTETLIRRNAFETEDSYRKRLGEYLNRLNGFDIQNSNSLYRGGRLVRNKNGSNNIDNIIKSIMNKNSYSDELPTSHDPIAIAQWLKTASPAAKEKYRMSLK